MAKKRLRDLVLGAVLGAALVAALALATPALSAVSADEASKQVAKAFGVEVLKVRPGNIDGRKVFVVTVMNPGGDFNEAFQVSTIVVDFETGKLVPGFRHRASGLDANQAPSYVPNLHSPDTLSWGFIWR